MLFLGQLLSSIQLLFFSHEGFRASLYRGHVKSHAFRPLRPLFVPFFLACGTGQMVCGEIKSLDMWAPPVAAGSDVVDGLFHITNLRHFHIQPEEILSKQ